MAYQIHNPQRVEQELGKAKRRLEKLRLTIDDRRRDVTSFEAAVLGWAKAHRTAQVATWNDTIVTTLIHSAVATQYNAVQESLAQAKADVMELETEIAMTERFIENLQELKAELHEAELAVA